MAVVKKDTTIVSIPEYETDRRNLRTIQQALANQALTPPINNFSVVGSTGVHVGTKTVINGPITINKIADDEKLPKEPFPNMLKEPIKGLKWIWQAATSQRNRRYWLITGALLISLIVIITVVLMSIPRGILVKYNRSTEGLVNNIPIKTDIGSALITSDRLRMVSRQEWLAQPRANGEADPLEHPIPLVIIHHTATEGCDDQSSCTFHVRFIQTFHIESRHWDDIGYNFLVGGDGSVYEGRGWTVAGAHTKGFNICSLGIAFVGLFNDIEPNQRQMNAALNLIQYGLTRGYIDKNYKLMGARQLSPSLSPGNALYSLVQKMDHYATDLNETQDRCTYLQKKIYGDKF